MTLDTHSFVDVRVEAYNRTPNNNNNNTYRLGHRLCSSYFRRLGTQGVVGAPDWTGSLQGTRWVPAARATAATHAARIGVQRPRCSRTWLPPHRKPVPRTRRDQHERDTQELQV